jgi:CRP-like cAMP-binding protein
MNLLLAGLNAVVRERLQPRLQQVPLPRGQTLEDAGAYAYFPTSGLVSLLAITADGGLVEFATVANDGVIGLPAGLHNGLAPYQATVQIAGAALRLRKSAADAEFARDTTLSDAVFRYTAELVTDISKGVICNALHETLQRTCRWLLTASDRLMTNSLEVKQETLAQALGVMRPSITRVTIELQDAGAIRCRYGRIVILNRALLERSSCDCYRELRPGLSRDVPAAAAASPDRRPTPVASPDRRSTGSPNPRLVR